jgi:hypothetical protein
VKKLLILSLTLMLVLSSCTSKGNKDSDNSSTLGDENGDGVVEDGSVSSDGSKESGESDDSGVERMMNGITDKMTGDKNGDKNSKKISSANDVVDFLSENVYQTCTDVLPIMLQTKVLTQTELDSMYDNLGIEKNNGIEDIVHSSSAIDSFSYDLFVIRTNGENTDQIVTALQNADNLSRVVSKNAPCASLLKLDEDIVFVSGEEAQVEKVISTIASSAKNAYDNVGEVIRIK